MSAYLYVIVPGDARNFELSSRAAPSLELTRLISVGVRFSQEFLLCDPSAAAGADALLFARSSICTVSYSFDSTRVVGALATTGAVVVSCAVEASEEGGDSE